MFAMAKPALISAIMYGAVALSRCYLELTPLQSLACLVLVRVLAYALLSRLMNRDGALEIWDLLAST